MKNITLCCLSIMLLLFAGCNKEEEKKEAPPPQKVTVYQTKASDVPIFQEFVG